MNLIQSFDACRSALASSRFSFTNELELQDGIASALNGAGIYFQRELVLSKADRVDFFVFPDGEATFVARLDDRGLGLRGPVGLIIEVKIDGGLTPLIRQLHRYAELDQVRGILVVTTRAALALLPSELGMRRVPVQTLVIRRGLR